jgi:hypothetical protein
MSCALDYIFFGHQVAKITQKRKTLKTSALMNFSCSPDYATIWIEIHMPENIQCFEFGYGPKN